jgi:long-chain acyl-CoA synthetase
MTKIWLKNYPEEVPEEVEAPEIPIHEFLSATAKRFPGRTATIFFGARLSYKKLDELSNSFANALSKLGVKKGDRVAVFLPNSPQYVISYFGILRAGGVIVNNNPMYVERELEYQINDSEAETIILLDLLYERVKNIRDKTPLKNLIITSIKDFLPPLLRVLYPLKQRAPKIGKEDGVRFSSLLKYPPVKPDVSVRPKDLALIQYTGGTTGRPKGTMLSHRNIVVNTIQARYWFYEDEEGKETLLLVMPLFHAYGMIAMFEAIYMGTTIILIPRFEIERVLKMINKYKPTAFPGVPTIWVAVNTYPKIEKYKISSIKHCLSAAAPLPKEVLEKFEKLTGALLIEGFGLTEASPVTHMNPIHGERKIGSIGIPVPSTDAKIVDLETGERELPPGEAGELIIKGPQVMLGYWKMEEETKKTIRDEWLYTGDIATMDEDGYFYIVDRKKDLILASGYNVYPREIEEVLYEHPKVKEAGVIGVPDEYRGEAPKAFIVLKEGEEATPEEIIEFCKKRLAAYKVPKLIEFRDDLPKTLIGKILRRELR